MDKALLRREHIERRLELPEPERARLGAAIADHLAKYVAKADVARVGLFLPIRGEPDLTSLRHLSKGELALPVVDRAGRGMRFHAWQPGSTLVANRFGILEPSGTKEIVLGGSDLLIVPCVALDRQGVRLGYGGGYYDVFLARVSVPAIGVVYAQSLVDRLPVEPHDRCLSLAATEHGIISLA